MSNQKQVRYGFMKYFVAAMIFSGVCSRACFAVDASALTSQTALVVEATNGTQGGTAVAGDPVVVQIYEHGQLLQTLDGKVADDGKAVFDNVFAGEHTVAVAGVKHQDMMFSSPPVALEPAEDAPIACVVVFDVSEDNSKLSVGTHHFIVRTSSKSIEITEYMRLRNSSDMAVSSKERDSSNRTIVLNIMLPKGFKNLRPLSYFEENALTITGEGFYDTMAVPPGEHEIAFSYAVDITSQTMDFIKRVSLPTSEFVVFAESGEAKLQGLGRPEQKLIGTNGIPMEYYKRSDLTQAEEITFQITGLNPGSSNLAVWTILATVFSALVLLLILRLRQ
ncbi:MAG: hypothetical protein ABIF19_08090 [Planctomycetota bacterium]